MSNIIEVTGKNTFCAGPGFIAGQVPGIVTVDGNGASREIELRERASRKIVATTVSAPDGTYHFPGLALEYTYDLIAKDHTGVYNDVIASNVTPHISELTLLGDQFFPIMAQPQFKKTWKIVGGIRPYTLEDANIPETASIEIVDNRFVVLTSEDGFPPSDTNYGFTIRDGNGHEKNVEAATPCRWWRINILKAQTMASAAEIEMAETIHGANLCTGGAAYASSTYNSTTLAFKAFDGNLTTDDYYNWSAATDSGWIAYTFPAPKLVRELRFVSRVWSSWTQYPINFRIERSLDGENWSVYREFREYSEGWLRYGWTAKFRHFDLLGPDDQYISAKLKFDNNALNEVDNVAFTLGAGNTFSDSVVKYGTHSLSTNNALDSGVTGVNSLLTSNICTLEGWFNFNSFDGVKGPGHPTSYHMCALFCQPVNASSGEQGLEIYQDGGVWKWSFIRSGSRNFLVATLPTLNTWHHVAFCSNGTTSDLFLDGIKLGTFPRGWIANTTPVQIGYQQVPSYPNYRNGSDCFIDHVRITNGRVLYTDNFTPEEWE